MDTLLTLLLMGILYVGSKIWSVFLSKINKSSQKNNLELLAVEHVPSREVKVVEHKNSDFDLRGHVAQTTVQISPNLESEKSGWSGKVDHNTLINGVIFGEILQPPRAYRPFVKR